ncbi:MAG TPA: hypothetical protein VFZ38_18835, partial [Vicinamibacterales bacterium]
MDASLRALNGFGLGARPGERGRVRDPRGWLRAQLNGDAPLLRVPAEATPEAIAAAIRAFRAAAPQGNDQQRREARQQARRRLVAIAAAESRTALAERVTTARPF